MEGKKNDAARPVALTLLFWPAHQTLSVGQRWKAPWSMVNVAVAKCNVQLDAETRRQIGQRPNTASTETTPMENALYLSQLLGSQWEALEKELAVLAQLNSNLYWHMKGQRSFQNVLGSLPIAVPLPINGEIDNNSQVRPCPLSGSPVQIAVRFHECTHFQCFDLAAYVLYMNQMYVDGRPRDGQPQGQERPPSYNWSCPVCCVPVSAYYNLVRDLDFERAAKLPRARPQQQEIDCIVID